LAHGEHSAILLGLGPGSLRLLGWRLIRELGIEDRSPLEMCEAGLTGA
jgi:hypothetical protein